MTDIYTIYLVNQSQNAQTFWCFLAAPQELINDPRVFANSSVSHTVMPNDISMNAFEIPVQYTVGGGASNFSVGPYVPLVSDVTMNSSLSDEWNVDYATAPPNVGPSMSSAGSNAPATAIAIRTNVFNRTANETNGWFSNQSFGISTSAGFIGMTWSPDPQQGITLTPELTFYVAIGSFGTNMLTSWYEVTNDSATVQAPAAFSQNACTVTYSVTGDWSITPGKPA